MFSQEKFSLRLRELRKSRKETQKAVADAIGVSVNQISEMEKGTKITSLPKLCLLCDYFHVSADYLLGQTDDGPHPSTP